jgi:hypothetical protein
MGVGGDEFFVGVHGVSLRRGEAITWLQSGKNGKARKGIAIGGAAETPLPYDGMTRTGSKGLSQPHQFRCGTPNVIVQVTGFAGGWQEMHIAGLKLCRGFP